MAIRYRDTVVIYGTDSYLDGQLAIVVGAASEQEESTSYILELEEDIRRINPKRWKCIVLDSSYFSVLSQQED